MQNKKEVDITALRLSCPPIVFGRKVRVNSVHRLAQKICFEEGSNVSAKLIAIRNSLQSKPTSLSAFITTVRMYVFRLRGFLLKSRVRYGVVRRDLVLFYRVAKIVAFYRHTNTLCEICNPGCKSP